jgi:riboflavin synthase alpha subunit
VVLGEKLPVLFVAKLTVPDGVVGLDEVSLTVARQEAALPRATGDGLQATVVDVETFATF